MQYNNYVFTRPKGRVHPRTHVPHKGHHELNLSLGSFLNQERCASVVPSSRRHMLDKTVLIAATSGLGLGCIGFRDKNNEEPVGEHV